VELLARMCHELDGIDMIGIPVMPQDIPDPKASLLYGVKAVVENSTKPIFFSAESAEVNEACIAMLKAAFKGDFQNQAYGISQLSPISPLMWGPDVIDAIMDTIATGVPIAILPEPIAGISAPYTLAGLMTVNNAECLSGLAMIQLLKPGGKVMYTNSWTTCDMNTGAALVGSAETSICRIAGGQLAQYYNVPAHTTAPNSDNHAHDEQSSWERTFSQFCAVGGGNDLIVNCGMFASGMTCSHEQLLMDNEISAICKRIAAGMQVTKDSIACDLIKEIGHKADYLTTDHTVSRLRSDEYHTPHLTVRGPCETWKSDGSKDTYMLAKEEVRKYENLAGNSVSPACMETLKETIQQFMSS